jgi:hypothetical protein
LKYEVIVSHTGNKYFRIIDIFAENDNYQLTHYNFTVQKNASDIYDIYADRGKIGTANLYSNDFSDIIV